jgi:prolyl-tRNA editing enzyme YbaK/EbsC (Cys-tRNA(Pro) deacylase)
VTEKTIDLDQHRGMAAQKATDLRRLLAGVEENEKALRLRQDELETHLLASPAANWEEAAEKAGYLLNLFATTLAAEDPRRQKLVAAVLADFKRLSGES